MNLDRTVGWMELEDIATLKDFADYAQQTMGVVYPFAKDMAVLTKMTKSFMAKNPKASLLTLGRTINWCVAHRIRLANVREIFGWVKFAQRDGWLSELDPDTAPDLDPQIDAALKVETDPVWKRRLLLASTRQGKNTVYQEWLKHQEVAGV